MSNEQQQIDVNTLEHKRLADDIRRVEEGHGGLRADYDDLDERVTEHGERISKLEQWRNGNGARGAEARLQEVEECGRSLKEQLSGLKAGDVIKAIATETAQAVIANARGRDKTAVARLKAAGPILAGLAALVAAVLSAVIK